MLHYADAESDRSDAEVVDCGSECVTVLLQISSRPAAIVKSQESSERTGERERESGPALALIL